jgi:hypothetical protein
MTASKVAKALSHRELTLDEASLIQTLPERSDKMCRSCRRRAGEKRSPV